MSSTADFNHRHWTVREARAKLSEVLRLAREEGPQHVGGCVITAGKETDDDQGVSPVRIPFSQWLLENTPKLEEPLDLPPRGSSNRPIPFADA